MKIGDKVKVKDKSGEVVNIRHPAKSIIVKLEDGTLVNVSADKVEAQ